MRYKVTLSYDGRNFSGSQIQPRLRTVQFEFEKALKNMLCYFVKTYFASRTDKFVHANYQVVSFEINNKIDPEKFKIGINKRLPQDIKVLKIEEKDDFFHARHSVKKKRYYYTIYKKDETVFMLNYGIYVSGLNFKKFKNVLKSFNGRHNFKGFCKEQDDKEFEKDLKIYFKNYKNKLVVYFESRSFLKQMIRILIGSAILVGLGKITKEKILENFKTGKRGYATYTAPGCGLFLDYIYY